VEEGGLESNGRGIQRGKQLRSEFMNGVRGLRVQRITATLIDRHNQREVIYFNLFRLSLNRGLRVEFIRTRRADDHEDDQQDKQHVDQRRDIDERRGGRPVRVYVIHFIFSEKS